MYLNILNYNTFIDAGFYLYNTLILNVRVGIVIVVSSNNLEVLNSVPIF